MRVLSLASGSSGNSYYISAANTNILVDCGISALRAKNKLSEHGIDTSKIDGLFITHEHSDHIKGAFVLAKRFSLPVYMSFKTYSKTDIRPNIEDVHFFSAGAVFSKGNLDVLPFPVPHDAVDPVGFKFFSDEGDIVIATDTGKITNDLIEAADGIRALILESNHDELMLKNGPYPKYLKARIASEHGHLSNKEASEFLKNIDQDKLEALLFCHLSRSNNLPKLVMAKAKEAFAGDFRKTVVQIADQYLVRDFNL
ncbi:MBL fold metallo-hydrolase [bacterium]|nr:MBL fold metallo-hydrolase [bacterium]